jgi:DNA-binding phage protein
MESKPHRRAVHVCRCPDCQQGRRSEIIAEHRAINQLIAILDEKRRRLFAGFWATVYGRGGIARLAVITGLSRTTIRRGQSEFLHPESIDTARIRRPGGGRKRIEKKPSRPRQSVGSVAPGCDRRRPDDGPEVDA